jgi:hypothetical protein
MREQGELFPQMLGAEAMVKVHRMWVELTEPAKVWDEVSLTNNWDARTDINS